MLQSQPGALSDHPCPTLESLGTQVVTSSYYITHVRRQVGQTNRCTPLVLRPPSPLPVLAP